MKHEINRIKNILNCEDSHAKNVYDQIAPFVDFSEITIRNYIIEVRVADHILKKGL
jgi:hypothetical protein